MLSKVMRRVLAKIMVTFGKGQFIRELQKFKLLKHGNLNSISSAVQGAKNARNQFLPDFETS